MALAKGARRVVPLQVSGAFHMRLMASAQEGMTEALSQVEFTDPHYPVVANCDARPLTTAEELKEELQQQLCTSVKWAQTVAYMTDEGVTKFIEIGPGRILTGMVKRISQEAETVNISDLASIQGLKS
jgi:[acyl-carrier-protein] S-malonyltransferase